MIKNAKHWWRGAVLSIFFALSYPTLAIDLGHYSQLCLNLLSSNQFGPHSFVPQDLINILAQVSRGDQVATSGFKSQKKLEKHFEKHGERLGAMNIDSYKRMALSFANSQRTSDFVLVGPRTGATFKYNISTEEFLVVSRQKAIETYFIPSPAVHGFATNLEYFLRQYEKY